MTTTTFLPLIMARIIPGEALTYDSIPPDHPGLRPPRFPGHTAYAHSSAPVGNDRPTRPAQSASAAGAAVRRTRHLCCPGPRLHYFRKSRLAGRGPWHPGRRDGAVSHRLVG